jgi:hypothetical protein
MIGAFFAIILPAVRYIFYSEPQNKRMPLPSGLKRKNSELLELVIKSIDPNSYCGLQEIKSYVKHSRSD